MIYEKRNNITSITYYKTYPDKILQYTQYRFTLKIGSHTRIHAFEKKNIEMNLTEKVEYFKN